METTLIKITLYNILNMFNNLQRLNFSIKNIENQALRRGSQSGQAYAEAFKVIRLLNQNLFI